LVQDSLDSLVYSKTRNDKAGVSPITIQEFLLPQATVKPFEWFLWLFIS